MGKKHANGETETDKYNRLFDSLIDGTRTKNTSVISHVAGDACNSCKLYI